MRIRVTGNPDLQLTPVSLAVFVVKLGNLYLLHLSRPVTYLQALGRVCLLVFSPRALVDRVAGTSFDFHDSGFGVRWFIKTPAVGFSSDLGRTSSWTVFLQLFLQCCRFLFFTPVHSPRCGLNVFHVFINFKF